MTNNSLICGVAARVIYVSTDKKEPSPHLSPHVKVWWLGLVSFQNNNFSAHQLGTYMLQCSSQCLEGGHFSPVWPQISPKVTRLTKMHWHRSWSMALIQLTRVKSNKRCRQCKYYSSFTSHSRDVQVQPPVTQRLCNITGKLIVQFAFKFTKSLHLRRKMILLIERNGWLWWWIWKIVCKQFQSLQSWINIQGIYWEDIYNTLAVKCPRFNLNFKP